MRVIKLFWIYSEPKIWHIIDRLAVLRTSESEGKVAELMDLSLAIFTSLNNSATHWRSRGFNWTSWRLQTFRGSEKHWINYWAVRKIQKAPSCRACDGRLSTKPSTVFWCYRNRILWFEFRFGIGASGYWPSDYLAWWVLSTWLMASWSWLALTLRMYCS